MSRVDPLSSEVFDGGGAEQIVTHSGHHEDFGATKPGRDRLIRALAAKTKIEPAAEDRLTGLGKSVRERRQVDIRAAYDCDSWASGHVVLLLPSYFPLIRPMNRRRKRSASEPRQTRAFGFNSATPSIS